MDKGNQQTNANVFILAETIKISAETSKYLRVNNS